MHDIHENPRSNVRSCAAGDGAICLKIEKLSHIMGPTPMLEMARASLIMAPGSGCLKGG